MFKDVSILNKMPNCPLKIPRHKIPELPEDLTVYFRCLVGMCNVTSGSLEGGVAAALAGPETFINS